MSMELIMFLVGLGAVLLGCLILALIPPSKSERLSIF